MYVKYILIKIEILVLWARSEINGCAESNS